MRRALATALLLVATTTSGAAEWQRVAPHQLTFRATQAGAEFEGRFDRYTAAITFNPQALAAARFDVSVETASVATQEDQRDELLRGPLFFASTEFPTARYVATRFRRDGNAYRAHGDLTLRGVTKPVALRFTWTPLAGGRTRLAGTATLSRLAFGVGQGEWLSTEWVGDEVKLAFSLTLAPQGATAVTPPSATPSR